MNVRNSVTRFAQETVIDPYGIGGSLKGHLVIFDDEKSSGVSSRRRIFESLPTYVMYSSNCIQHNGQVYIVGEPNYDYHKGYAVRAKYVAIPCDREYKIASITEILTNTVTSTVSYIFVSKNRLAVADSEESSSVTILEAIMPSLEDIKQGDVIFTGDSYYRVKSTPYIDGVGFKCVEVIELDSPVKSLTFTQEAGYDPVTDTIVNSAVHPNTPAFVEDSYYFYDNTSQRYTELKPGDKTITIKPPATPKAGDLIDAYKILSVDHNDTSFSCHCRV